MVCLFLFTVSQDRSQGVTQVSFFSGAQGSQAHKGVGIIQFLAFVGQRPLLPCWPSARSFSQLLKAACPFLPRGPCYNIVCFSRPTGDHLLQFGIWLLPSLTSRPFLKGFTWLVQAHPRSRRRDYSGHAPQVMGILGTILGAYLHNFLTTLERSSSLFGNS